MESLISGLHLKESRILPEQQGRKTYSNYLNGVENTPSTLNYLRNTSDILRESKILPIDLNGVANASGTLREEKLLPIPSDSRKCSRYLQRVNNIHGCYYLSD